MNKKPHQFAYWYRELWERFAGDKPELERRHYFKESEIKDYPQQDFEPIFLPKRKVWVTESGYFRLWRDKAGAKGIDFAHSLKDFDDLNLISVRVWKESEHVHNTDIKDAIDDFTRKYEKAKRDVGTLYETEPGVLWRHAAIAYRRDEKGVKAYLNVIDSHYLTNPYGNLWWERVVRKVFDKEGVNLFEIFKACTKDPSVDPSKTFHSLDKTENLIFAHYQSIVSRHLQGKNPINDSDQKLHPLYYKLARLFWFGVTLCTKGVKNSFETADMVDNDSTLAQSIIKFGVESARNIIAGVYFLPFIVLQGALLIYEATQSAIVGFTRKKLDGRHSLTKQLTEQLDIIPSLKSLLLRRKKEAFTARGTVFLSTSTFDTTPPLFLKKAMDEAEEQSVMFLGPDSNRTMGSIELLVLEEERGDAKGLKRRGRKIIRPDGFTIIELLREHRKLVFADPSAKGHCAYPDSVISCSPSHELEAIAQQGKVLDIKFKDTRNPYICVITREQALEILRRNGIEDHDHGLRTYSPEVQEMGKFVSLHQFENFSPKTSSIHTLWKKAAALFERRPPVLQTPNRAEPHRSQPAGISPN